MMTPSTPAKELYTFTPATFIENIAVRSNGHLLLSTFEQSRLYGLDPNQPGATPHIVAEFPGVTALTGIAEIAPDVFAIGAGVKGGAFKFDGDMSVFTVDLNNNSSEETVTPKLVARVPGTTDQGSNLNGMTSLPENPHVVLGADSLTGEIHRVNTKTGAVDVAFGDASLTLDTVHPAVPIGVNGIRAVGRHLYFANSAQGIFGRYPITSEGDKAGDVEVIVRFPDGEMSIAAAYDDFAVAPDESFAYISTHPNRVMKVDIGAGGQEVFFQGSEEVQLMAPTSGALGRDGKVLYVCTGGMKFGEGKMEKFGAQVVRISLE